MFHKILVAIDRSKNGEKVFDAVIALTEAMKSSLMLLHVLSSEEEGSPNVSVVGLQYYPIVADKIAQMHQQQWAEYESRGLEKAATVPS